MLDNWSPGTIAMVMRRLLLLDRYSNSKIRAGTEFLKDTLGMTELGPEVFQYKNPVHEEVLKELVKEDRLVLDCPVLRDLIKKEKYKKESGKFDPEFLKVAMKDERNRCSSVLSKVFD
jgi:hypothetical protein